MTNEIEILKLEDVDLVEGNLTLRIGGVELKHVYYFADDEYMYKEGTVGSIHNVLLQFQCLQVQAEDPRRNGIIPSGHGDNRYDCFGKVAGTGQDEGDFCFLLECDTNIHFPCRIRTEKIGNDVKAGMFVKTTGYFEAWFVDSEFCRAVESMKAEWEALPEEEKREREERFKMAMEEPMKLNPPSLLQSIFSIVTESSRRLFGRKR